MKKFTLILSALMVLMCGFMFMGCDELEDAVNDLVGPENTWCELPVYVTANKENGDQPDLYLDVIFVPEDYQGREGSTNLSTSITLQAGITVVAHASVDISSLGMSAGSYTMKTFSLNATESDSEDNASYSFAGTKVKWTTIYRLKKDLRNENKQIKLPKAPTPVCNTHTGYTELTDFSKFNWRALLASYLLN